MMWVNILVLMYTDVTQVAPVACLCVKSLLGIMAIAKTLKAVTMNYYPTYFKANITKI